MNIIEFEIPGEPQGKRRARFVRAGHFIKSYAEPKCVSYETYIREMFCIAYPEFVPVEGQLAVEIKAFCGMPKSVSKKKRALMENGEIRPAKRPETDNIAKVILDALTGLAFKNDSQVTRLLVEKSYSDRPRVEVEVNG
jgi:Holliday junction resolvase RusA-like endonuclease